MNYRMFAVNQLMSVFFDDAFGKNVGELLVQKSDTTLTLDCEGKSETLCEFALKFSSVNVLKTEPNTSNLQNMFLNYSHIYHQIGSITPYKKLVGLVAQKYRLVTPLLLSLSLTSIYVTLG